jgi:hypothetical protein
VSDEEYGSVWDDDSGLNGPLNSFDDDGIGFEWIYEPDDDEDEWGFDDE